MMYGINEKGGHTILIAGLICTLHLYIHTLDLIFTYSGVFLLIKYAF